MSEKASIHFKIIPGSIIKATKDGYLYCQTEPVHPHSESRSDRKARYIYLHRVTMENHLGRLLTDKEQVDHKDKDKTNNKISNLELVTNGDHQRDHVSRGNHFWKKSPRNKPRKKKASQELIHKVLLRYLSSI